MNFKKYKTKENYIGENRYKYILRINAFPRININRYSIIVKWKYSIFAIDIYVLIYIKFSPILNANGMRF